MTLEQMINEQQMLLNAARTQGRSLTAEEQARFDSLQRLSLIHISEPTRPY